MIPLAAAHKTTTISRIIAHIGIALFLSFSSSDDTSLVVSCEAASDSVSEDTASDEVSVDTVLCASELTELISAADFSVY